MRSTVTMRELSEARYFNERIKAIEDRIKELQGLKATWSISGTATYSTYKRSSAVEEVVIELDKQEQDLINEIRKHGKTLSKVEKAVSDIPGPEGLILTLRYINSLSWKEIARRTNYSMSHVYRLHTLGLEKMRVNESK